MKKPKKFTFLKNTQTRKQNFLKTKSEFFTGLISYAENEKKLERSEYFGEAFNCAYFILIQIAFTLNRLHLQETNLFLN